jgi:hypothetical protein
MAAITNSRSQSEMRAILDQEMKHIPSDQGLLRATYQASRMNSLGKNAELPDDRAAVMRYCLDLLRKKDPHFEPAYDKVFFDSPCP